MAKQNYSLREVYFIKENTPGVINITPKLYRLGVTGLTLSPAQKTESNPQLGQDGQATAQDTGSKDFGGNVSLKFKTALSPILLHCVAGVSNKEDATTDSWTASTVYTEPIDIYSAGQIVNHSNGTHTLVVKSVLGTGISGTVEPDISALNEYDTIVDNEITWTVRRKLYKHTGTTDMDVQSVGIYTVDNTADEPEPNLFADENGNLLIIGGDFLAEESEDLSFRQYFAGSFFNSLTFSKTAGITVFKKDIPIVGMKYVDNTRSNWEQISPTDINDIEDKSFTFDDMKITFNGIEPQSCATDFSLSINRNVSIEDTVEQGERCYNVPSFTIEGSLKQKLTKEEWQVAYESQNVEVKISYANEVGDVTELTFPVTKKMLATIERSTDKFNYLTIPLSPSGATTQKTMTYKTISSSDW